MQPPAQELVARDLHDTVWTFRHIYRGVFYAQLYMCVETAAMLDTYPVICQSRF